MKGNKRIAWMALVFVGLLSLACGPGEVNPRLTPSPEPSSTPISSPTPVPSPTPKPKPTTITTTLECFDIIQAITKGGTTWADFYVASLGAPLHFDGYVFQIDWDKDLISVMSEECQLEIWLKGIPHSTVEFTSYTQLAKGIGTIEAYPDKIYLDEVLIIVDLSTLDIR